MATIKKCKRDGKEYGQYYVVYRDVADPLTGRRRQVWEPAGTNKRRALAHLAEIEEMLVAGTSPNVQRITFAHAWQARMNAASMSGTTRPRTENVYKTHFEPYFGGKQVRSLNTKQVFTAFKTHIRAKGIADKTVANILSELRAFMNWCYASDYISVEPKADWWDIPKGHSRNQRPLTYQQVEALADAVSGGDILKRAFVLFSAYVGTRLGETRAVRWEDFSEGMTEVWVRRAWQGKTTKDWTKTGDTRHTPLVPRVREVLEELRVSQGNPAEGWVFADENGNAMDGDNFRHRYYDKGKKKVGLGTYRIHDLRHTCCSLMHKAGATPREIMTWLGWKNLTTLLRYLHNFDEEQDIAAKMQERWTEAMSLDAQNQPDDAHRDWSCDL